MRNRKIFTLEAEVGAEEGLLGVLNECFILVSTISLSTVVAQGLMQHEVACQGLNNLGDAHKVCFKL